MSSLNSKLSLDLAVLAANCPYCVYPLLYISHIFAMQTACSDWKRYRRSTHLTWIVPKVGTHYWPAG